MSIRVCVSVGVFIIFSCVAVSLLCAEETLTLDRAILIAYQCNPYVVEARTTVNAARGELITASALPDPEIEFEIGGMKANEEDKYVANLDKVALRQPFDPIGVREVRSYIAQNEILIRGESVKGVWAGIYRDVRDGYSRIILDKKELELVTENLNVLRQFYSRVELQVQSGKAMKNELERAKIELLEAELKCLGMERELKTDKGRLNILLGRSADTSFEIKEELREEMMELNYKDLTRVAFEMRPDIKAEVLGYDSKVRNVTKEKLGTLPAPFIGYDRTTTSYENDSSLTIGMRIPAWHLNQGEIKKAKAERDAQWTRLEAAKRQAELDVYEAFLDAEFARRQVELFKTSVDAANELLRLADQHYSEGEIDFLNFLDQVRTSTQARVRYYEGLFALNSAISQLEKTIYASLRKEKYLQ